MKKESGDRRADRRTHPCDRRDSERQQQEDPDYDKRRSGCPEREPDQDTEEGRDALAAAELEPDRIEMPDERTARGEYGGLVSEQSLGEQDCGRCLETVQYQGQRRQRLASGPEYIGRADISR